MKTIIFANSALKDLERLPRDAQDRIIDALNGYAINGLGDIKRLSGRSQYRLRIGQYRVIFSEDRTTILAIYIGKRDGGTYRRH